MGLEAMVYENSAVPANSREIGKKKRANRSAKLKQCKLNARREQWLSQVKKNENKDTNVPASPTSPLQHASESKSVKRERLRQAISTTPLEHDEITHQENSDTELPISNTSKKEGSSSNNSITSSSSGSSIGSYSRSVSDAEEDDDVDGSGENGGGGLDDWEAVADALSLSPNENHVHSPSSDGSAEAINSLSTTRVPELTAREPDRTIPRAWRSDDVYRPQSLPNLMKHRSFPMERHFDACHNYHAILSPPPSACPICYEDLDLTDSSFLPCDCGFHLCLFCHKRILEADARCPGCRKQYNSMTGGQEIGIVTGVGGASLAYKLSRSCSMSTPS